MYTMTFFLEELMSLDDKDSKGPEGEEPWNPDDEKIEKKYLKKVIELIDRQMKREDDVERKKKVLDQRLDARIVRGLPPPPGVGAYMGLEPNVTIRPIENGFLVIFQEIAHECESAPMEHPRGSEIIVPVSPIVMVRQVEAFVRNEEEAAPLLKRAFDTLRKIREEERRPPIAGPSIGGPGAV